MRTQKGMLKSVTCSFNSSCGCKSICGAALVSESASFCVSTLSLNKSWSQIAALQGITVSPSGSFVPVWKQRRAPQSDRSLLSLCEVEFWITKHL